MWPFLKRLTSPLGFFFCPGLEPNCRSNTFGSQKVFNWVVALSDELAKLPVLNLARCVA